jgi:hypothetical protein
VGPLDGSTNIPDPAITNTSFYSRLIETNPDNLGSLVVENSPTCTPEIKRIRITSIDSVTGTVPNPYLILPTLDPMTDTQIIYANPVFNPPPANEWYALNFTMELFFDNA